MTQEQALSTAPQPDIGLLVIVDSIPLQAANDQAGEPDPEPCYTSLHADQLIAENNWYDFAHFLGQLPVLTDAQINYFPLYLPTLDGGVQKLVPFLLEIPINARGMLAQLSNDTLDTLFTSVLRQGDLEDFDLLAMASKKYLNGRGLTGQHVADAIALTDTMQVDERTKMLTRLGTVCDQMDQANGRSNLRRDFAAELDARRLPLPSRPVPVHECRKHTALPEPTFEP